MSNPFTQRTPSLDGPALDILPVTPSDSIDIPSVAIALYVEVGGLISILTVAGGNRVVALGDRSYLPVGVVRVMATGTTATGIHALVVG